MHQAAVSASWGPISDYIKDRVGTQPGALDIYKLGDALSPAFRTAAVGRSQGDVTNAGSVWERLIVWYINLISFGTDVIATTKHREWLPSVVSDSVAVNLRNRPVNTESDVLVFTVPSMGLTEPHPKVRHLDAVLRADLAAQSLVLVQCKTNWNENAQIPMLWDMIYTNLAGRGLNNVRIGKGGVSVLHFRKFAYAFMTVPTLSQARMDQIKQTSLPAARVSGLSGGNYWGWPTKAGVSTGFSDFLTHHFAVNYAGGIPSHVGAQLAAQPDLLDRFLAGDFLD